MKIPEFLKASSIELRGVIHVGAFMGNDYENYKQAGAAEVVFIEPSKTAFKVLNETYGSNADVLLFNVAAGSREFSGNLNVEKSKSGFYNSLLKPGAVINKTTPALQFSNFEQVKVRPLDAIPFKRSKYNLLVITTNGYEAEVIKAAKKTIADMDCIVVEAYAGPVYEGVSALEEIDRLLAPDFKQQTVHWVDDTGIAFYVRPAVFKPEQTEAVQAPELFFAGSGEEKIIAVPPDLQPVSEKPYIPEDNSTTFEEWYFKNLKEADLARTERHYLPVFWKNYYKGANHGFDQVKINYLQAFIDQLDATKKYFTIVEYDEGIINDISKLDIKLFASAGQLRENDYPLPVLCVPHQVKDMARKRGRDLFANYPLVTNNHVAKTMNNQLAGKPSKYLRFNPEKDKFTDIKKMLYRTVFLICPRSSSQSSYFICEALQFGAIPVYISDDFIIPHHVPFEEYGVLIEHGNDVDEVLSAITPEQIQAKQSRIAEVYARYYTFAGCKERIAHTLLLETNPAAVDFAVDLEKPAQEAVAEIPEEMPDYFKPENDINLSEIYGGEA